MGFQLPASKANLNDICPSYVAHALSIANTLGSITGFVSPAIAGELLDRHGNDHTSWEVIWSISGKSFYHLHDKNHLFNMTYKFFYLLETLD